MKILLLSVVVVCLAWTLPAVEPVVRDVVTPPDISGVRVKGRPGELMARSIDARAYSTYARTTVYDEAENSFATHWDDLSGQNGWQNEYWGKTMLCYAGAVAYTRDPELTDWVLGKTHAFISKYQKPNGYLCTYAHEDKVGQRKRTDNPAGIWNFSIWGRKYTMWALLDLYHATGDKACLEAAVKMGDHLIAQLERIQTPIELTGSWAGLSPMTILKPMLLLYRETGKPEYLAFCRHIVEVNDIAGEGKMHMNLVHDALSDRPISTWFGDAATFLSKAYELMSFFEGLAEFHRVTGDARALAAVKAFHRHLVDEELNPMRSASYFDHFLYARRHVNGMTELCDVTHWIRLNRELWLLTGEAEYLDLIEQAFYNAFLAGVTPDGDWGAHIIRSHGSRHLTAPHQTGMMHHQCCPDNMLRTFFDWAATVAGVTADGAVQVNLYSDADVALPGARIEIAGGYPVTDFFRVKATFEKAGRIRFRVPSWSKTFTLNGKSARAANGWYETAVPAGCSGWTIAFDLSPRILASTATAEEYLRADKVDPGSNKVIRDYTIQFFEWYNDEMRGLERTQPAAQVMRGPLVLAKGRLAGTTREATLEPATVNGQEGWTATLKPAARTAANMSVWGAWTLELARGDEKRSFPVADYWSVSCVNDAANWFSLWF